MNLKQLAGFAVASAFACAGFLDTAQAAPSPRMLVETADLSGLAISPDGLLVAFRSQRASVERNTYDSTWYVRTVEGRDEARRIADGGVPLRASDGESLVELPTWSADSKWVYYRALFNGQVQAWRARADGSSSEQVTEDAADVESFVLSDDGQRLLYQVHASREEVRRAEEKEYDSGVLIGANVPVGQGLFRSALMNDRLITQRFTGQWMNRQGLLEDQPARVRVVELATRVSRDALESEKKAFASAKPSGSTEDFGPLSYPVRNARGRVAYIGGTYDATRLKVLPAVAHEPPVVCGAKECNSLSLRALAWRADRDEVVFTAADRDQGYAQSLYLWDVARNKVRLITHGEGLLNGGRPVMGGESCAVGAKRAVCVAASANTPPRLERVDLESGARVVLFDPNRALAEAAGPKVELLRWSDAQGRRYTGRFFPAVVTSKDGPSALFVTYYTCPGYMRGGAAGDEWPMASLAGAQIASLCINKVQDPDAKADYGNGLASIEAIVKILVDGGIVDPKRVGMGGLSFGSEMVYWVATHSTLLAAASVTSSAMTPTYFWFHDTQLNFRASLKSRWRLGAPDETPDEWHELSVVFQTEKIRAPLLMQMPEQEYLQTMEYFDKLVRSSTPVELYAFPHEPHNKFLPRHMLAAYERNLDWFRFWLQGYVDADSGKADQYRRWVAMREKFRGGS